MQNKGTKYLLLFVVCLALMFLSSSLLIFVAYAPYYIQTSNSFTQFNYDLVHLVENPTQAITFSYSFLQLISYVPILIVVAIFLREEIINDIKDFKANIGRHFAIIAISFGVMLACGYIVNIVYASLGDEGESANESIIKILLNGSGNWLMILSVAIFAPIVEEIIFRKLLFATVEEKFKWPPVVAIILSALIFSLIHVTDLASIKYIFQYIALALPMCLCYHFSKNNICTVVCVHMINNILSIIATFLYSTVLL